LLPCQKLSWNAIIYIYIFLKIFFLNLYYFYFIFEICQNFAQIQGICNQNIFMFHIWKKNKNGCSIQFTRGFLSICNMENLANLSQKFSQISQVYKWKKKHFSKKKFNSFVPKKSIKFVNKKNQSANHI